MTEVKKLDGQEYRAVGEEPHTRQDGTATTLVRWQSRCAECGQLFDVLLAKTATRFNPNRRCQKHRKPGRPVNRKGNANG
jgi:hypothetical protein